jgi:arginyl-tRNA synthetase
MLTKREEIAVIRLLAEFPAAVTRAAEELRPHIIAHYAYDLCEAFNSFYHSLRVLQAENEKLRRARLALVSAVRTVLRNCLDLLVIPIIERM